MIDLTGATPTEISGAELTAISGAELTARFQRPSGPYVSAIKPLLDRVLAAILLVVTAPAMVVLAVLVRATMGRGVLLEQRRIGLMGRPITVYRFRTTRPSRRTEDLPVDHDRRLNRIHAADPRLTPLGRFMRKWGLNELPQLLNIARGEMSFVGPHPELEHVVAGYELWQHGRHVVRPGLTGLAQVSERAGGKLMCECTEIDIEYVETISLLTDLRILARTPMASLTPKRGV